MIGERRVSDRTLAPPSPEEALRLADVHDFDLLLTDLLMPEISGRELVRRIEAVRPGRPALFMSGYGEELLGSQRMIPEGAASCRSRSPSRRCWPRCRRSPWPGYAGGRGAGSDVMGADPAKQADHDRPYLVLGDLPS